MRECPYAGEAGPQFYDHFRRAKADVVRHHMRKDIREAVGLGSPPAIFTTNNSEALNSVLKKQVGYKKTQWPEFVQEMKVLIDAQRNEIIRALSGRGRYRLSEGYRYLGVSMEEWNKMRPDQRKMVVQHFDSAQLVGSASCKLPSKVSQPASASFNQSTIRSTYQRDDDLNACVSTGDSSHNSDTCPSVKCLDISAEDSGIHTIPLITLQAIWNKAVSLLNGDNLVTPTPGSDRRARAVMSYHSDAPHIVRPKGNGQYVCDSNCPQWMSSKICSHTVAVAQLNNSLREFLDWFVSSSPQPNITALAMSGMPSGRGRKKNQVPRSRVKVRTAAPDTIVSSPHSLVASPVIQPPAAQLPSPATMPFAPVGQSNYPTPSVGFSLPPPSQAVSHYTAPANTNPFYLKFVTGNIRVCQGCRNALRRPDGAIPNPPYDLTVARAERRPFRDTSGNLITPKKEIAAHYHCRVECIKAAEPNFVPWSLHIPRDIYHQLGAFHREYLSMAFGLGV